VCVLTVGAADTLEVPGVDIVSAGILVGVGAYECYEHCGSILHAEGHEPTAGDIISGQRRGKVNRQFPGELRDETVAEIEQAARGKGQAVARAKKALKLLKNKRWDK
jgi:hypothetical protein